MLTGLQISEGYLKIAVFLLILGSVFLWQSIVRHKKVRKIQDTPRTKISSAPQGLVEIQGFAWPINKSMQSVKGFELVYYKFSLEVEKSVGTGRSRRKAWVKVFSEGFVHPFYVMDPTGLVIVDPSTAEMELGEPQIKLWSSLKKEECDFYLNNVLPKDIKNFPPKSRFSGFLSPRYRIVETEVRTGCPIYVTGDFKTYNAENKKITAMGLTHFSNRIIDYSNFSLKNLDAILDKDKDGKVTYDEAKDGYSLGAELSKKRTKIENITEREFDVYGVIAASRNHRLFLADSHEHHVLKRLQRGFYARVLGGAASLSIALVMILRIFISDSEIESAMTFEVPKSRRVIADTQIPVSEENIKRLHQDCVSNNVKACVELLNFKEQYGFKQDYVIYYQNQACNLGEAQYCLESDEDITDK